MNTSKKILTVLNSLFGKFPDDTLDNVKELIYAGEPKIALEILITQLIEYEVILSKYDKLLLLKAANEMNLIFNDLDNILSE